jgi:hypothetical protein
MMKSFSRPWNESTDATSISWYRDSCREPLLARDKGSWDEGSWDKGSWGKGSWDKGSWGKATATTEDFKNTNATIGEA